MYIVKFQPSLKQVKGDFYWLPGVYEQHAKYPCFQYGGLYKFYDLADSKWFDIYSLKYLLVLDTL